MTLATPARLIELDADECRELLGRATLGRLAYTEAALPAVRPVSFVLYGDEIVIPTGSGSKVAAASRGAVVAFEVDEIDPVLRTGWDVTVVGPARVVTDPGEVERLDRLGARAWVQTQDPCYVAVALSRVSGRRVVAEAADHKAPQASAEPAA